MPAAKPGCTPDTESPTKTQSSARTRRSAMALWTSNGCGFNLTAASVVRHANTSTAAAQLNRWSALAPPPHCYCRRPPPVQIGIEHPRAVPGPRGAWLAASRAVNLYRWAGPFDPVESIRIIRGGESSDSQMVCRGGDLVWKRNLLQGKSRLFRGFGVERRRHQGRDGSVAVE